MKDMASCTKVVRAYDAKVTNADANGEQVDRKGFESLNMIVNVGTGGITFTGTNSVKVVLQHRGATSGDDSTWADVTDKLDVTDGTVDDDGVFVTLNDGNDDNKVYQIGYVGEKRYVRVQLDFSGSHGVGTPISVTALLGHPRHSSEAEQG